MKRIIVPSTALLLSHGGVSGEVIFGGADTREVANWTTSSVAFDDTVQSGHSMNWENVITNSVVVDPVAGTFDLTWEAAENHTIGHLFMYNAPLDLATLTAGIERFYWVADFESTGFSNWSPVISVTTAGVTRYYRWNHSGNDWSGNGFLNFSAPFNGEDPYRFDLSQLGNGTSAALGIWGELNSVSENFGFTRDNNAGPNLQATEGEVRFGFLQWASSPDAALPETTFSTSIDSFEVIINADGGAAPEVAALGASEVTAATAKLGGELTRFGTDFSTVSVYWGESDGGSDPLVWGNVTILGVRAGRFDFEATGLERGTNYFYRFYAENSVGGAWSATSESFTTGLASEPSVVVVAGSSSEPGSATFNGEVTDTGNEDPQVTLFYGLADGGTNPGNWDAAADLGTQGGVFSTELSDLEGGATYFYRVFVENSAGAAWSPEAATVEVTPFAGVAGILDSAAFDFLYEMDENPGFQDLDAAGNANDWFAIPAQATGVDRTMTIPQTYQGGLALSNQGAAIPEALFRTDFTGSILRQSITGSFSAEVSVKLEAGTIDLPGFDLGGFGIFINPPGQPTLRLNIGENEVSLGDGTTVVSTGSNTDGLHRFRVAWVAEDQRYHVWRDGVRLFGEESGIPGTGNSVFVGGGLFFGDFASDLSGDWQVDYIRLHNEATSPIGFAGRPLIVSSGFVNPNTFFIDFVGAPNAAYRVTSSSDQRSFATEEPLFFGADGTTNETGIGRAEFDITGRFPGRHFFRVEPVESE